MKLNADDSGSFSIQFIDVPVIYVMGDGHQQFFEAPLNHREAKKNNRG